MPGVPTSRGCSACRKQKKKCDITQYPCPRCARLNIPCTGFGERRYKFKDETKRLDNARNIIARSEVTETLAVRPSPNLSSPTTRLTAALIEKIGPVLDVRYHLSWSFGPYLYEVPRLLGASEALDSAADVVVTAHARFCAGFVQPDPSLITKHSTALSKLRTDLDDPAKARSSETLCSIMLHMIYQSLTKGARPSSVTHTDGATQILKGRGYSGARNDFEKKLLSTLRGPVVVEALMKDNLPFTQQEWKDLVTVEFDDTRANSNPIRVLARIPYLLQRCRKAKEETSALPAVISPDSDEDNILILKRELRELRDDCSAMTVKLHDLLTAVESPSPVKNRDEGHMHAQCLAIYSMGLSTAIIINCILSGLDNDDDDNNNDYVDLSLESSHYSQEIVSCALSAARYLPLGAMSMVIFLRAAHMGALDIQAKEQVQSLIFDYHKVCWGGGGGGDTLPLRTTFDKDLGDMTSRFTLRSVEGYRLMQERHLAIIRATILSDSDDGSSRSSEVYV